MEDNQCEQNRQMQLMQSFWQMQKVVMVQVKQTAADNDLSVPQFAILILMERDQQMAQKKLHARTHFPKSTLSHAVEGLVKAGLLNRFQVEGNRREMDLELSKQGRVLMDGIKSQEESVHVRFKNAVNSFSEEAFDDLIRMHQQIVTFFEGAGEN